VSPKEGSIRRNEKSFSVEEKRPSDGSCTSTLEGGKKKGRNFKKENSSSTFPMKTYLLQSYLGMREWGRGGGRKSLKGGRKRQGHKDHT